MSFSITTSGEGYGKALAVTEGVSDVDPISGKEKRGRGTAFSFPARKNDQEGVREICSKNYPPRKEEIRSLARF